MNDQEPMNDLRTLVMRNTGLFGTLTSLASPGDIEPENLKDLMEVHRQTLIVLETLGRLTGVLFPDDEINRYVQILQEFDEKFNPPAVE